MVSNITPVDVIEGITEAIPGFFNDAFDQFRQGEGGYIANGQPEGPIAQIGQAIARSYCRQYGAGELNLSGRSERRTEQACRLYLDNIGAGGGIGFETPFSGGQCSGNYTVEVRGTITIFSCSTGAATFTDQRFNARSGIAGPISALTHVGTVPGACGSTRSEVRGVDGNGVPFAFPGLGSAPNTSSRIEFSNVQFTLLRDNGLPDDCGNPAPVVVPRTTFPDGDPSPVPVPSSPGPGVVVDVTVNPDGTISFGFGDGPTFNVDPFAGGDGGDGGGPVPPAAGEPGEGQSTGSGSPEGDGGLAEGEAPEGKVLTGVRVDIVEFAPSRRRYTSDVDRGVGYVYMGTPSEGLGLDPTGATVRSGQFFFAQKDYLTKWAVRANNGYNLSVIPFYKDAPE